MEHESHFEVNRTDITQHRVVESVPRELDDGQIRISVERFAVTANNISYAVSGDLLGYWDFFPAEHPWGRLPAMGLGSVVESAHPDIDLGGRYFGFYPMSDQLVVSARAKRNGFGDVGAHRADHASVYTSFEDVTSDPFFVPDRADEFLLLRGLFMTSFLQADQLEDLDFHGAEQTLVTSASSKTSIALAMCLRRAGRQSIGLTSAANRSFVESLGLYDRVISYDEISELDPTTPSGMVDMAGNAAVRAAVHGQFADVLTFSSSIGATHHTEMGGAGDLPGPKPEFFFAPAQIAKRTKDWGADEVASRIGAALGEFIDDAPRWLTVVHRAGPDGMAEVYDNVVSGTADPSVGYIVSMQPHPFEG